MIVKVSKLAPTNDVVYSRYDIIGTCYWERRNIRYNCFGEVNKSRALEEMKILSELNNDALVVSIIEGVTIGVDVFTDLHQLSNEIVQHNFDNYDY
ncbi:MAG: hypothetical protein LBL47_00820 [Lactobacillus sp.]|jgi:hypothetical protein|nr:hypothetical protein [Lactobacillus sp.]